MESRGCHAEASCQPSYICSTECRENNAISYYWPFLGSCMHCVFLAEMTLQQMSVCGCGMVFGLIIEPWWWESRRKASGTSPPFASESFLTPSCIFSSPARSGMCGAVLSVVVPAGPLFSFLHVCLKQSFIFCIPKDFHCHKTLLNKLAGSSTVELVIKYHGTVLDFI